MYHSTKCPFFLATDIYVWRPFYNFRSPKGDFEKVEVGALDYLKKMVQFRRTHFRRVSIEKKEVNIFTKTSQKKTCVQLCLLF